MALPSLDEADFARFRQLPAVRRRLRTITPDHYRALGCYLVALPAALLTALYCGYLLDLIGLYPGRWLLFILLGLGVAVPLLPFFYVRTHIKRPVLDALAEDHGFDYASDDFELETLNTAMPMLFGTDAAAELADLLADPGGDAIVCHAEIARVSGDTLYSGLIYTFSRASESGIALVMLPSEAATEGLELPITMKPLEAGPAWQAWSNRPHDARALVERLAGEGPLRLYLDRTHVLVAGGGPDSFDAPASAATPEARLRAIFDNVAAALNRLRALQKCLR